jgi:hypothetical protein
MAGRMTVVAVRRTGHVLGAITAVAPGAAPSVTSAAGDAMPVDAGGSAFAVPATELAVADLGFDVRAFNDPHGAWVLFPDASDQSPSLAFVDGAHNGQVDAPLAADTLTVSTNAAAPTKDLPFWVLFQGLAGDPPLIVSGMIPAAKTRSDPVAHGLTSGASYDALVLVTGVAPHGQPGLTPP